MTQVTDHGRVMGVKMFDGDMRAEITFSGTPGILTLKLTDNKQSAFSGMVALASSGVLIPPLSTTQLFVTYDDDDREINEMELR
jgi:hypothetical protein